MLTCVLCVTQVDLFDLDDEGWMGEPAHKVCASSARRAAADAIDQAAAARAALLARRAEARAVGVG